MTNRIPAMALALALGACSAASAPAPTASPAPTAAASPAPEPATSTAPTMTLQLASELDWEQLNPARGDASPKAANVWGDRKAPGPTGFVVRFVDGFQSPPHIHNVSYRGVVIRGLAHNDHPDAKPVWMPAGSFWTQPKGAVHITAAKGADTVAYIEIDDGPYLVRPVDAAFATEESAVNVAASKVAWLDAATGQPAPTGSTGPRICAIWEGATDPATKGSLVEVPQGTKASLQSSASFRAVVIAGRPAAGEAATVMDPGSSLLVEEGALSVSCRAGDDCTLYVRTAGELDLQPLE